MGFKQNLACLRREPKALRFMAAIWGLLGLVAGLVFALWKGATAALKFAAGLAVGCFLYHLLFGTVFSF